MTRTGAPRDAGAAQALRARFGLPTALTTPGSLHCSAAACRRGFGGARRGRSGEGEGREYCQVMRVLLRLATAGQHRGPRLPQCAAVRPVVTLKQGV